MVQNFPKNNFILACHLKNNPIWVELHRETILAPNVGGVARQNSRLGTSMLSADDGERQGKNFSELCAKKESAGKAGLREKG